MAMMKQPLGIMNELEVAKEPKPIIPSPAVAKEVVAEPEYKNYSLYLNVEFMAKVEALAKEKRLSKSRIIDDMLREKFQS